MSAERSLPERATHPVQTWRVEKSGAVPTPVAMRAYEVYVHLYRPQKAMITGDCRGGFAVNEYVAFLYARSFPKEEWRARVDEATRGMKL